jgi:hypothetical protein
MTAVIYARMWDTELLIALPSKTLNLPLRQVWLVSTHKLHLDPIRVQGETRIHRSSSWAARWGVFKAPATF